ncbi:LysE/ArgO family amino acid transporter [Microbacterium sp.]|uniref:LysE/ArgO family amino acid transporter n=1 Tax=Microbacterium sp. TaxID=51671 RepID=UPI002D8E63F4|nr:LysE/ArgO family amino acid transporter [Microbacterium sp.]
MPNVGGVIPSALAGFGLGLSLIVAIGAQNIFVLRQGLRREHVLVVAAICAASDAVLIALGVSGIGLVLLAVPWIVDVVRWAGALFLTGYGILALRRALTPGGQVLDARAETDAAAEPAASGTSPAATATKRRTRLVPVILTCLALTWLNPHVYLDTVFLLGSVANTHGDARWVFAVGAMAASVLWFFGLALGARFLSRWLSTPRAWRILDGVIAVVMFAIAVSLVLPS